MGSADKKEPQVEEPLPAGSVCLKPEVNELGYQKEGAEYVNTHPGGGVNAEDSELRSQIEGRIVRKECGVGVVGQSLDDMGPKQICGVLSQPISKEPNVYAQEVANAIKAIEERIEKKQKEFKATQEDLVKIGSMIRASMCASEDAPFSPKKIMD